MGLLGKLTGKSKPITPTEPAPDVTPAPPSAEGGISFAKSTGKISMTKGSAPVMITKTATIRALASWPDKTDYDVYAYVVLRTGEVVPIAAFGAGTAEPKRMSWSGKGKVTHLGDVGRGSGGMAEEIIEIVLGEDIAAVVPVAYSAQSNGSGSFYRYKVSLAIDNGAGDVVTISSAEASKDDGVYTCVPGVIYNRPEGVGVERLELYSRRGENRPRVSLRSDGTVSVEMDQGPRNDYK